MDACTKKSGVKICLANGKFRLCFYYYSLLFFVSFISMDLVIPYSFAVRKILVI